MRSGLARYTSHTSHELDDGRGPTYAEDLIAELEADPEFVARREREVRGREARWVERRQAEVPLREDLRGAGIEIDSAWDLANTPTPYRDALPILLEHLRRPYPDRVREGIARALAVRDTRFAWDELRRLYEVEPAGTDAMDGLAVALAAVADRDVIDEVIVLARDPRHGSSRLLLLRALRRSRAAHVRAAFAALESDPVLATEVRRLLKR